MPGRICDVEYVPRPFPGRICDVEHQDRSGAGFVTLNRYNIRIDTGQDFKKA